MAETTAWPEIGGRRIGAVSSFGFSGTNAHVVVEAAPVAAPTREDERAYLAPLSAHHPEALRELAGSCKAALTDAMPIADVVRTLSVGRAHRAHRAVVRGKSTADLRLGFEALARGDEIPAVSAATVARRDPPRIAFLFTGQGAQYPGMAAKLYATAPAFRDAFDRCDAIAAPLIGASLRQLVFESFDGKALEQTGLAQPALFAVEYSLAFLLRELGITPVAVLGHSAGEYVAACIADALDLPDALRLVVARGALMQSLPAGGTMAAVFASESQVVEVLGPYVDQASIAAVNGPAQTVVSGTQKAVDAICDALSTRGIKSRALAVSHAFHSPLVEPILDALETEVARAAFKTPRVRIISNVTGRRLESGDLATPRYWRQHAREAVRFADGLGELAAMKIDICIEIGPHPALSAFAASVFESGGPRVLPTLKRDTDDWAAVLDTVAGLFLEGAEIRWGALDPDCVGRPISLPGPVYKRTRHWFREDKALRSSESNVGHALLGAKLLSPLRNVVQFEALIGAETAPFIADHSVQDRIIMPAAGMIEMGLSAGRLAGGVSVDVRNFIIAEPLVFSDTTRVIQTVVHLGDGHVRSFELSSRADGDADLGWTLHALGDFAPAAASRFETPPALDSAVEVAASDHYGDLETSWLVAGSEPASCSQHPGLRQCRGG